MNACLLAMFNDDTILHHHHHHHDHHHVEISGHELRTDKAILRVIGHFFQGFASFYFIFDIFSHIFWLSSFYFRFQSSLFFLLSPPRFCL